MAMGKQDHNTDLRGGTSTAVFRWVASVVVILFVWGLIYIGSLRFSTGREAVDFSTYSTDVLGCGALYETLNSMSSVDARRVTTSFTITRLQNADQSVLFFIGLLPEEPLPRTLLDYVSSGGHMVLCMTKEDVGERDSTSLDPVRFSDDIFQPLKFWKLRIEQRELKNLRIGGDIVTRHELEGVEWIGAAFNEESVSKSDAEWNILASAGGLPVVIQTKLGDGLVTLTSDSYFLTNQSLMEGNGFPVFTEFIGSRTQVLFDEQHHGIVGDPGVVSLMRHFNIHFAFYAVVLVFILFIWNQSQPMLAVRTRDQNTDFEVEGRSSMESFMNSAGRFINIKSVPQTMFSMFEKDVLPTSRLTNGQKETLKAQLRSILNPLAEKKCSEGEIEKIFNQAYHVTNQALHPEKNFRITPDK